MHFYKVLKENIGRGRLTWGLGIEVRTEEGVWRDNNIKDLSKINIWKSDTVDICSGQQLQKVTNTNHWVFCYLLVGVSSYMRSLPCLSIPYYRRVFGHWAQIDHQTLQTFAIVLGFPPELNSKMILLKISRGWIIGHEDIKLVLTWKLHLYCLAFIVWDGAMQTTRKWCKLWTTLMTGWGRHTHWC